MQTYRRSQSPPENGGSLLVFIPFIALGFILTLLSFLVYAGIYAFTPVEMGTSEMGSLSVAVSLACVLVASIPAGRLGVAPGWLSGCVTGLGYGLIVLIAGALTKILPILSPKPLLILFACAVAGAVGGIIGINLKARRRRLNRW